MSASPSHVEHARERGDSGPASGDLPAATIGRPVERSQGADQRAATPLILALVPPLLITAIQFATWALLRPYAWFLYYFAVLVSARIAGLRGGLLATGLSTLLAWWFFVPPEHSFVKGRPQHFVAAAAFAVVGGLISVLQGRLRAAERATAEALAIERAEAKRVHEARDEIARLVEQASDAIFVGDRQGNLIDVNAAGSRMLGYSREELLRLAVRDLVAPEDAERLNRENRALDRGSVRITEFRLKRKDATLLPVEVSAKILPDGRWQGIVRDITERKRAESELRRLNCAQRALSRCNMSLIRASDEGELLTQICRIVVEDAGYRFCWVGRGEHDEARSVRPIAQAGHEAGYLEGADIHWADDERGRGPIGTAIREGRPVVVRDIATDPRFSPWRARALERGYLSSTAVPFALDSSTTAAMSIYASEPDAFGDQEVALLRELVDDLAYGLATLRTRAERDKAQDELKSLNAELEARIAARTAELSAAHEREAEAAGEIQRMLLLDEPPRDVRGLSVAALTVPSQRVSGDFYGFFRHEEADCLDVVLADVMGKGLLAALVGAATKAHFPEALWHLMAKSPKGTLPEPREIVTLAHARMARRLIDLESFLTTFYARFDVTRRALELVDCGHTGAIHFNPRTGACRILHGENLPLGVREGEVYDQMSVPLEVGDTIVLFSDGVTEARSTGGELFGPERVIETVQGSAHAGPAALTAAIRDAAASFTGGRALRDDLTCVAVQLVEAEMPAARSELEIQSALRELQRAREFVEAFCMKKLDPPLAESAVKSLVLAVNEAACNIMKHAYRGREDQRIEITAEAFGDRVSIRLRHLGVPFDRSRAQLPSFDGSRGSGFGVFLMEKSVDAVSYYTDHLERHCVALEKRRVAGS